MQHKKLVPVHNMLRGYTFSGASAGDAISIMGTSAGDDFINIKGKQLYTIAIRILDPLVKNHIDRLFCLTSYPT
jgi:hypothetical protein